MRRVKKTTNEQFNLLKAEMAVHPAAARGYGVGAQRAVVDAEWKDIVEKLNALGPPERTMTEWKKVWSDVRLRMKKQSIKKPKKPKKPKQPKKVSADPAEDQLMEALNSSISIYETHIKSEHSADEHTQDYESYEDYDEDDSKLMDNNCNYSENNELETPSPKHENDMEQTLNSLQQHLEQQNKIMQHLLQISSNMTVLMKRHVKAEEKKTSLMERQLKLNEYHNVFLRRQDSRRKFKLRKPATD